MGLVIEVVAAPTVEIVECLQCLLWCSSCNLVTRGTKFNIASSFAERRRLRDSGTAQVSVLPLTL